MPDDKCGPCKGTGVCDICYGQGSGEHTRGAICSHCKGNGVCGYCGGTGMFNSSRPSGPTSHRKGDGPARFKESMRLGLLPD